MKKLKQVSWISFKKSGQPMIKSNDIESFSKQLMALTTRWQFIKLKKKNKKKKQQKNNNKTKKKAKKVYVNLK